MRRLQVIKITESFMLSYGANILKIAVISIFLIFNLHNSSFAAERSSELITKAERELLENYLQQFPSEEIARLNQEMLSSESKIDYCAAVSARVPSLLGSGALLYLYSSFFYYWIHPSYCCERYLFLNNTFSYALDSSSYGSTAAFIFHISSSGLVGGGAFLAYAFGLRKVWKYLLEHSLPITEQVAEYIKQRYQEEIYQKATIELDFNRLKKNAEQLIKNKELFKKIGREYRRNLLSASAFFGHVDVFKTLFEDIDDKEAKKLLESL